MNAIAASKLPPPSFRRKQLPPKEFLEECFEYSSETGVLKWKNRPPHHFISRKEWMRWNSRYAGTLVGNKTPTKQKRHARLQFDLKFNGQRYLIANHIAIFAIMNVEIPSHLEVDHINGDGWDNRWENLRLSTRQENCRNRCARPRKRNLLPKGVFQMGKRFYGKIGVDVKTYLTSPPFTTPEEAQGWYLEKTQEYHKDFACVRGGQ